MTNSELPSLQEILHARQREHLVGRELQVADFRKNLMLPVDDEQRRFIMNIFGVAGVGKTSLAREFQRIAEKSSALCAWVDEECLDAIEAMSLLQPGRDWLERNGFSFQGWSRA